jgi:flagellar biosynthesis protein FlhA
MGLIEGMRKALGRQSDLVLVLSLVGILIVLFTPIPAMLLDFLLIANFSFALLILLLTFYMRKPLEFSTFPSLLLIATLFRLSLNIAATRLILAEADAGNVISAIGSHVVGGNYIIGLIVFIILVVVQYVVVTNGAQRVAEVAARFTLDSMPGKQMSIDADMNMGLIDEHQARQRRKDIEKEANFYGAMDGASKFVKGDAIAGIIIVLVDIIAGLAIGIAQMGMSWGDALHTYTLLTVGDGIVTQVPALVIATGTGIIVTRAASDAQLSDEISKQVTAYPKTLILVAAALLGMLFLPGIPALPVLALLVVFVLLTLFAFRVKRKAAQATDEQQPKEKGEDNDIYGMLTIEPIEITVGQNLIPLVGSEDSVLMERIVSFRKQYALEAGFVIPKVRIKDNKKLNPNEYQVRMYGAKVADGEALADRTLAINPGGERQKLVGVETRDPTYGLPATWITEDARQAARTAGYTLVDGVTVLMTHLSEVIRQQSASLLTRAETERLINRMRPQHAGLLDELIPAVLSLSEAQKVLQNLLREKVSIRNLESILEVLVDNGARKKDPEFLTELVRQRLGPGICQALTNSEGDLYVLTLDPAIEQAISNGVRATEEKSTLVLEPTFAEQVLTRMAGQVEKMMNSDLMPVLLCSPSLRRHIRQLTERVIPHLSVLSLSEVPNNVNLKAFGMVNI